MKHLALALTLLSLAPAAAAPPAQVSFDDRGVGTEIRAGGHLFLTDLAVSLTAPGWAGDVGSQRRMSLAHLQRRTDRGVTTIEGVLPSDRVSTRFRQTIRPIAGGVRLEYELAPDADVEVENVLLMGWIPVQGNAGSTRFVAAADDLASGVCPAELAPGAYFILGRHPVDWLALVAADGSALRLKPEGLALGMQDDRKFGTQGFALHATAGDRRVLRKGQAVRFVLEIAGDDAAAVDAAAKQAGLATLAGVPFSSTAPLSAGQVALDHATVDTFDRVELTPAITAAFDNPFDPDDVAVDAEITRPDGTSVSVPGFYMVPFRVESVEDRERLRVAGPACWKVRFTPTQPGAYRAVVRVKDRSGRAECPPVEFRARPSRRKGFVRVAEQSPAYFRNDDGSPYFPVGENMCWCWGPAPLAAYRQWLGALGKAGGNWARLWLSNNEKGLEWMPSPTTKPGKGSYLGLGRYALDNAWRLDEIVRLAEEDGVRLMFCLGTYGELLADDGYFHEGSWVSSPYNAANGGPCRTPDDFWTDATARKLYQRRLRYLVARWGYSPTLFAWEFWNEAKAPAAWVQEMGAYLKQLDPNRHLVSTTYGDDAVWRLPEVDFTMTHTYGDSGSIADFTDGIARTAREQAQYGKPYLLAEFGIDWRADDGKYDPQGKGQNLHNGLWAGALSGAAGTAMLWYWDGYVHPKNLYSAFTPIARFAAGVDWAHTRFAPVDGIRLSRTDAAPERFTDVEILPGYGWGMQGKSDYTVLPDGTVEGGPVASTLGSPNRSTPAQLHSRLTFALEMPADGRFGMMLGTVSSRARLQIKVDGALRVDESLDAGAEGKGPWKAARYLEQWKVWQSDYDKEFWVPVPAGKHTVSIECAEGDWLSLKWFRIPAYRSSRYPDAQVLALRSDRLALLWLHNRQSNWKSVLDGKEPDTLAGLSVALPGMPAGKCRVEWWDTYTGRILRRDSATPAAGCLTLAPPAFARDVAAAVRW